MTACSSPSCSCPQQQGFQQISLQTQTVDDENVVLAFHLVVLDGFVALALACFVVQSVVVQPVLVVVDGGWCDAFGAVGDVDLNGASDAAIVAYGG
jgi:hypothetical protein